MNRLVYLYELDSVRNTEVEIKKAEKALCEQILVQGNIVVLSFNQLTDSDGFLHLLNDEKTYEKILELFRAGAIKVSRFGNYRTPSQYVQAGIEKCLKETVETYYLYGDATQIDKDVLIPYEEKPTDLSWPDKKTLYCVKGSFFECTDKKMQQKYEDLVNGKEVQKDKFLFSGIPVKSTDRKLLECMRDALKYNAIDFLKEEAERTQKIYDEAKAAGENVQVLHELKKRCDVFPFLIRYVNMLITMSIEQLACNPPKKEGSQSFAVYMKRLLDVDYESVAQAAGIRSEEFVSFAKDATVILQNMYDGYDSEEKEKRSIWIDDINKNYKAKYDIIKSTPSMAIAIVDMCYNYTIEDSIANVSKRYNDKDGGFEKNYVENLYAYWQDILKEVHELTKDEDNAKKHIKCIMPWETASRVMQSVSRETIDGELRQDVMTESVMQAEQKEWKKKIDWNVTKNILFALMYVVLFVIIELIMNGVEEWAMGFVDLSGVISDIISIVVFGAFGSVVALAGKKYLKIEIPDILESVSNIFRYGRDANVVSKVRKGTWVKKLWKKDCRTTLN